MDRIRQKNNEGIAARIHPQRSPGEPRVTKAANWKDLTPRPRERRVNVPTKAARSNAGCRLAVRRKDRRPTHSGGGLFRLRHQLQRRLLQRKITAPACKPVQKCLREQCNIASGGENPRMPRNPSHPASRWIVNSSAQKMVVIRVRRSTALVVMRRRSGPRNPFFARQITSMRHAKRPKDMFLRIDVQRLAAKSFHQRPQSNEVDVGVLEVCTRRGIQRCIHRPPNTLRPCPVKQAPSHPSN